MSATKTVSITLKCDNCRMEFAPYEPRSSISEVRRIAREQQGWSIGKRDLCYRCK